MADTNANIADKLADAARLLENFAASSDVFAHSRFEEALKHTFIVAARMPVAMQAVLHLIEENGKLNPVYAINQLIELSTISSVQTLEEQIYPLVDRLAAPETLKGLNAYPNSFPRAFLLNAPVTTYLLDQHIGFNAENLTTDNVKDFMSIADVFKNSDNKARYNISRERLVECAKIYARILLEKQFEEKPRDFAVYHLGDKDMGAIAVQLYPTLLEDYRSYVTTHALEKDLTQDVLTSRFRHLVLGVERGSPFESVIIDLYPQVRERILNHPEPEAHWPSEKRTAAFDLQIANETTWVHALQSMAFENYKQYATKNMTAPEGDDAYEINLARFAVRNRASGWSGIAKDPMTDDMIAGIREAMQYAADHRTPEQARDIQGRILSRFISDHATPKQRGSLYEVMHTHVLSNHTTEQILDGMKHTDGLHYQLIRNGGLNYKEAQAALYQILLARTQDDNTRLKIFAHFRHDAMAIDYDQVIESFSRAVTENPEQSIAAYKDLSVTHHVGSGPRPSSFARDLTAALLPHVNRLSDKARLELSLFIALHIRQMRFEPEIKEALENFLIAAKPDLDAKHPAFKVDVDAIRAAALRPKVA